MSDADPRDYRTLGDLLRDAREERKLDLEQVNEATKISVRVLAALEKDDLEAASGAIYARGFVRTLAKYYDLDPEWLGAKLDQLAGETSRPVLPVDHDDGVIAGPVADRVVEEAPAPTGPKWEVESTRVRRVGSTGGNKVSPKLIYGLVAVLVIAIILVVWLSRGNDRADHGAQRTPASVGELAGNDEDPGPGQPLGAGGVGEDDAGGAATADSVAVDAAPTEVVIENLPASPIDRSARQDIARQDGVRDPAPTQRAERTPAQTPAETPVQTPGPETVEEETRPDPEPVFREVEDDPERAGPSAGLPSVLRPAEGAEGARMVLRVIADSPVEVTIATDGGPREVRFLAAGKDWVLNGRDHFVLSVSDPAAVRVELDGRPRPAVENWSGQAMMIYPWPGND